MHRNTTFPVRETALPDNFRSKQSVWSSHFYGGLLLHFLFKSSFWRIAFLEKVSKNVTDLTKKNIVITSPTKAMTLLTCSIEEEVIYNL